MKRIKSKAENYISHSQSAYRANRSTTDVIWSHYFIIAEVMLYQNMDVQITGLDMSSAFDMIEREQLMQILELILKEDEIRMCRLLLRETSTTLRFEKDRSSRPEVFCKKDVVRNFAKFTGKHLCQSLFFNKVAGLSLSLNFIKKETLAQVFSCEFCEISNNTFSYRTPPVAASEKILQDHLKQIKDHDKVMPYQVYLLTLHLRMLSEIYIVN